MILREDVPGIVLPAWANAGYILSLCDYDTYEVNIPAGNPVLICPSDTGRWAIGFSATSTLAADVRVSAWGDPSKYGAIVTKDGLPLWLTLLQYGPMTTYQWYATCPGSETILVHTVSYRG